jgi:hypothetical protein
LNKEPFKGDGIVIFKKVAEAMQGERVARGAGYETKLIAPPPNMRMGCDLALEVNLVEKQGIERSLLEHHAPFVKIMPLNSAGEGICEIVKVTDFGKWYMVKSGNMKLTFEKATGIIVNISGGGCPDIPYLCVEMSDKALDEVVPPNQLGFTLCATMLQRAYEEALVINGRVR